MSLTVDISQVFIIDDNETDMASICPVRVEMLNKHGRNRLDILKTNENLVDKHLDLDNINKHLKNKDLSLFDIETIKLEVHVKIQKLNNAISRQFGVAPSKLYNHKKEGNCSKYLKD